MDVKFYFIMDGVGVTFNMTASGYGTISPNKLQNSIRELLCAKYNKSLSQIYTVGLEKYSETDLNSRVELALFDI